MRQQFFQRHQLHLLAVINMKAFFVFLLVVASACAVEYYTDKYDDIDIDSILQNERLFNNYLNCLLEKGKCTEEGRILKEVIPDALLHECMRCSPKQRPSIEKVFRYLVKQRSDAFDMLVAKYDPNGTYKKNYAHYLEKL